MKISNVSEFIRFELQYRKRRPATFIFFFLMVIIGFAVSLGAERIFNVPGLIKINAPIIIDQAFGMSLLFAMFLISALMGVSVIRDYQHGTHSLFFTKPIQTREYLLGRFMGSFLVTLMIYSGVIIGLLIPEILRLNPNLAYNPLNPLLHLRSFMLVALPGIFFLSALFFTTGALSKKTTWVYLQGFLAFLFFSIMDETLVELLPNRNLAAVFDFFLIQAIHSKSEFWSIAEQNSQLMSYSGVLLINRVLLVLAGILLIWLALRYFRISPVKSRKR